MKTKLESIFYCNLGWRSALAAATVRKMSSKKVIHMRGEFDQWVKDIS